MVVGGQGRDSEATNTVEIFEFDRANPANSRWRGPLGGHMAHKRFMADAVLLPDETVLVVNGAASGTAGEANRVVRHEDRDMEDAGPDQPRPDVPLYGNPAS